MRPRSRCASPQGERSCGLYVKRTRIFKKKENIIRHLRRKTVVVLRVDCRSFKAEGKKNCHNCLYGHLATREAKKSLNPFAGSLRSPLPGRRLDSPQSNFRPFLQIGGVPPIILSLHLFKCKVGYSLHSSNRTSLNRTIPQSDEFVWIRRMSDMRTINCTSFLESDPLPT
jgi:hypothetical protein